MKELIGFIMICCLIIGIIIWFVVFSIDSAKKLDIEINKQRQANMEFVTNCINSGGSIQEVGNGITTTAYFICNKKQQ